MPEDRFGEIIKSEAQRRAKGMQQSIARMQKAQADKDFEKNWNSVYPPGWKVSGESVEDLANRIEQLSLEMRERFWDFCIAEHARRIDLKPEFEASLIILSYACAGRKDKLRECLSRIDRQMYGNIIIAHGDWFDVVSIAVNQNELPPTPPLNRQELRKILGVSYDKLSGEIKAEKWQRVPENEGENKQRRRWRHRDQPTHVEVLKKIREKYPEKLWPDH